MDSGAGIWYNESVARNRGALRKPVFTTMLDLRREYNLCNFMKTCINLANYNLGNEIDLKYDRGIRTSGPLGERIFPVDQPDEDDLARFEAIVNNTTQIYWPDDELSNIVWEAIGPYFAGDKSLDDTLRLLDNRVGLYINERR